jgi:hypothetical protein
VMMMMMIRNPHLLGIEMKQVKVLKEAKIN